VRFAPGQSGNPAGRPPGSLNRKTLALEAVFMAEAEETVKSIIERAKDGQPVAMRLCMQRALPTGRNRPVAIALPAITGPADARAAIAAVTAELAEGNVTIDEAASLLHLIDRMVRLAERIRKIEKTHREEDAAAVAAQPGTGDAVAAPQAPAPDPAAADDAPPVAANGKTGEALYFPVNDESYRRDAAACAGAAEHRARDPAFVAPGGAAGESLYFPVNEAA
jgi:Family of unknown function (DUF5681)